MPIIIRKKASVPAQPKPDELVKPVDYKARLGEAIMLGKPDPTKPYLDGQYRFVRTTGRKALVSWWLIACYLKAHHDLEGFSAECFADMQKDLRAGDNRDSPYHHLLTDQRLQCGHALDLTVDQFPPSVRAAARALVRLQWGLLVSDEPKA